MNQTQECQGFVVELVRDEPVYSGCAHLGDCPICHGTGLVTEPLGKCSVPMYWGWGGPAGCCGKPAFGERPEGVYVRVSAWTGRIGRTDGRYAGIVPGLACVKHGGPYPAASTLPQDAHKEQE